MGDLELAAPVLDRREPGFGVDTLDDLVLRAGRTLFDVGGVVVGRLHDRVEQSAALHRRAELAEEPWEQDLVVGELGDLARG